MQNEDGVEDGTVRSTSRRTKCCDVDAQLRQGFAVAKSVVLEEDVPLLKGLAGDWSAWRCEGHC